jgi:hypothetical protein
MAIGGNFCGARKPGNRQRDPGVTKVRRGILTAISIKLVLAIGLMIARECIPRKGGAADRWDVTRYPNNADISEWPGASHKEQCEID